MRRNTLLRFRVRSVTYVYVRALTDTHRASSCSHLRRFSVPNERKLYSNNGAHTVEHRLKKRAKRRKISCKIILLQR